VRYAEVSGDGFCWCGRSEANVGRPASRYQHGTQNNSQDKNEAPWSGQHKTLLRFVRRPDQHGPAHRCAPGSSLEALRPRLSAGLPLSRPSLEGTILPFSDE
jgi:hypothetical protein